MKYPRDAKGVPIHMYVLGDGYVSWDCDLRQTIIKIMDEIGNIEKPEQRTAIIYDPEGRVAATLFVTTPFVSCSP